MEQSNTVSTRDSKVLNTPLIMYKQMILPMMCLLYNLPASFYQIFLPMRVFRHTTDLDGYLCKLAPNVGTVDSAYQHETHASRLEKNLAI